MITKRRTPTKRQVWYQWKGVQRGRWRIVSQNWKRSSRKSCSMRVWLAWKLINAFLFPSYIGQRRETCSGSLGSPRREIKLEDIEHRSTVITCLSEVCPITNQLKTQFCFFGFVGDIHCVGNVRIVRRTVVRNTPAEIQFGEVSNHVGHPSKKIIQIKDRRISVIIHVGRSRWFRTGPFTEKPNQIVIEHQITGKEQDVERWWFNAQRLLPD